MIFKTKRENSEKNQSGTINVSNRRVFDEEYFDVDACCNFLGIAKPTLYLYTSKNTIPHFKIGKMVRFKKSDLVDWIEERRVPTHQDLDKLADLHMQKLKGEKNV